MVQTRGRIRTKAEELKKKEKEVEDDDDVQIIPNSQEEATPMAMVIYSLFIVSCHILSIFKLKTPILVEEREE